ncbi:MAG: helix-hairpin-helix domain-containing protein [Saprospiraceae bacterium]
MKQQLKDDAVAASTAPTPKDKVAAAAEVEEEVEETVEEVKTETVTTSDDLKKIEGIGPKIAELLQNDGIKTFKELSEATVDRIKEILTAAGSRYKMHDPTTWPDQAKMAANGEWDKLKEWQDSLQGGKE